jgi:hypothetical protein
MNVEVGSNLYQNTDGTIEIEGVPQLQLGIRASAGTPVVNFALFDENGRMVAKLVDSTLAFNERRAYELTKIPSGITLRNTESGKIVLQVEVKAPDLLALKKAEFRTVKGHLFQVSATDWRLDKQKKTNTTTDAKGGAVVIGA